MVEEEHGWREKGCEGEGGVGKPEVSVLRHVLPHCTSRGVWRFWRTRGGKKERGKGGVVEERG